MPTSIKAIKESLEAVTSLLDPLFQELATDTRSGVQKALKSRQKVIQAELAEEERLESLRPLILQYLGKITQAATTGPARSH